MPALDLGGDRYHSSHVLEQIGGSDDGAVVLGDGRDLAVLGVQLIGDGGSITACDGPTGGSAVGSGPCRRRLRRVAAMMLGRRGQGRQGLGYRGWILASC